MLQKPNLGLPIDFSVSRLRSQDIDNMSNINQEIGGISLCVCTELHSLCHAVRGDVLDLIFLVKLILDNHETK